MKHEQNPTLKVEKENKEYAQILLEDYAGNISEDTAIHQYLYQALIVDNSSLKKSLTRIAITEMHHLHILGEIIELLGGNPFYGTIKNHHIDSWDASNINYEKNPYVFLKNNITQENIAIKHYKMRIKQIDDDYIKEILENIILDEQNHIKIFYSFLEEYTKKENS